MPNCWRSAGVACIRCLINATAWAKPTPIESSSVEGRRKDGVSAYLGIPFAAPPVGVGGNDDSDGQRHGVPGSPAHCRIRSWNPSGAFAEPGEGYVPVAPNYAGFDSSTLSYHPHERGSATEMPPSRRRITARLFLRSAWTQRSRSSMRIDGDRVSQFILSIARFNSRSATAARASLSLVPGGNSNTSDLSKEFVMRTGAA